MTHLLELPNLRQGYVELVEYVAKAGDRVSPRGMATRECEHAIISLADPTDAVPIGVGRKLNLGIASAEMLHLIGGFSDAAQMVNVTSSFGQFTDGSILRGAYGPRAFSQWPAVISRLAHDSDTRQANVAIWRPDELLDDENRDVPCTLNLHFMVRRGRLDLAVEMRSNDVWLGTAYDIPMFTGVQRTLAWALGYLPGRYTHLAMSLHLYERDLEKAQRLIHHQDEKQFDVVPPLTGLFDKDGSRAHLSERERPAKTALTRWRTAQHYARIAALGLPTKINPLPKTVQVHADRLRPTVTDGILCTSCRYVYPRTREHFGAREIHHLTKRTGTCLRCRGNRIDVRYTDPERVERLFRKRCAQYGVTPEWFNGKVEEQNGLCRICRLPPNNGRWKDFVIDHDHETGEARGLICSRCNQAIGLLDDDPERAIRLAEYLR